MSLAKYLYLILESNNKITKRVNYFISLLIIISIINIILESYRVLFMKYYAYFQFIEYIVVIVFSIEYLLRLYIAPLKYNLKFYSYIKFIFSPAGIIDLLAILPFYLFFLIPIDLTFVRIFRVVRIFKFSRYFKIFNKILVVLKKEMDKLLISIICILVVMLLFSICVYYAERTAQPEVFINIPSTFWWGIITMTTVGYGDMYPITTIGKILASAYALISIFMLAIPTAILTSSFLKEFNKNKRF